MSCQSGTPPGAVTRLDEVGQGGAAAQNQHKRRGARQDVSRSFQRHPGSPDIPTSSVTGSDVFSHEASFNSILILRAGLGRTEEAQSMTTDERLAGTSMTAVQGLPGPHEVAGVAP